MPVTGARRRPRLRSALWLPLFDDLADPVVVARLAGEAEEAGWHGAGSVGSMTAHSAWFISDG